MEPLPIRMPYRRTPWPLVLLTLLLVAATAAYAQDIEPRSYSNAPIGVFDSGLGGLTVVREMLRRLPGRPLKGESYYEAEIKTGRVSPEQSTPKREF